MDTAGADDPRADSRSGSLAPRTDPQPQPSTTAVVADHGGDAAMLRGCPYLQSAGGGWRLDVPMRDHRCAAFSPPAPLSLEKQGRLCLTAAHTGCATYLASLAAREERLGAAPVDRATRWGLARTTTVIEDPGGLRGRLVGLALDRRRWPAIPAVILVTTLFTLAVSGFRGGGVPANNVATASPGLPGSTLRATARPSPTGSPVETPVGSPGDSPSALPSDAPTAAPATAKPTTAPSARFRTYRVQSGDTLSAIAARFDTTVSAIVKLNHITDPGHLGIGQVLLIP